MTAFIAIPIAEARHVLRGLRQWQIGRSHIPTTPYCPIYLNYVSNDVGDHLVLFIVSKRRPWVLGALRHSMLPRTEGRKFRSSQRTAGKGLAICNQNNVLNPLTFIHMWVSKNMGPFFGSRHSNHHSMCVCIDIHIHLCLGLLGGPSFKETPTW